MITEATEDAPAASRRDRHRGDHRQDGDPWTRVAAATCFTNS